MNNIIKILKIIFLIVAIAVGALVIKGLISGNMKAYVAQTAIKTLAPETKLTPTQKEMLDTGNYEGLVEDLGENVTPEQIDCASQSVGVERAKELMITKDPTPQEILKLSKCL